MYNNEILDHNNYPNNYGNLDNATICSEISNASCGDLVHIYLLVEKNTIVDAKFTGVGCAISKAATDVVLDLLRGKTIEQAKQILNNYRAMILGEEYNDTLLSEAKILKDISKMPARTKCALLPYQIIEKF